MSRESFKGKRFLITGATGLIGKTLVRRLLFEQAEIIAVVRDIDRAMEVFENNKYIKYIKSDVLTIPIKKMNIDYIIHAAANTSSKAFIEDPISIINVSVNGTERLLELARLNQVKGFVYLSSMEVYGTPETDEKIDESHSTNLDTLIVRSCYPESKRLCENLCIAYVSKYGVPAKIVRLTQTIGPGVNYNDNRVFAEFARCVIEKRDIVLKTKGETKRSYLYTHDAVEAIITVLLWGKIGEAYNVANEETYCSIYEMARLVADKCAEGKIGVRIEEEDNSIRGFAPTLHMNLDTTKIRDLGWKPVCGLTEMYENLIEDMKGFSQ